MAPFKSLGTVSYSHFVATMAVSRAVCELFSIEEWLDLENWVGGCSRSLKITFIEVMNGYRVALFMDYCVLQMSITGSILMTGRYCKINKFTCGLIHNFDLIVNCDKLLSN